MLELKQCMEAFQGCIMNRDQGAAEQVLHAQYALVLVQPAPAVMARQRWIAMLPRYIVDSYDVEEQAIDVDGDCAAVMHRASMKATFAGEDRSGLFIISDVWRRGDSGWRVWRRHSTPLSAGALPSVDA